MRKSGTNSTATAEQALRAAVEQLYITFACYPLRPQIEGCQCCVSPADDERIHSKPLRELTAEDLEKYAFDALFVWGNEDDLRHFLPRLFEIVAFEHSEAPAEVVFAKLSYAGWPDWPMAEQAVVETYLFALWPHVLSLTPYAPPQEWKAEECLCSLAQAMDDLRPFLDLWRQNRSETALQHLAELLDSVAGELLEYRTALDGGWWDERRSQADQVIGWLLDPSNRDMLEQAVEHGPAILDEDCWADVTRLMADLRAAAPADTN